RSNAGRWSLLYDSKATHLLCVALGPDGSVFAGSDGEGLIYRVGRDGKATILFDAPQAEIRTLLVTADGVLYAGTAAESGGGGGTRNSLFLTKASSPHPLDGPPPDRAAMVRGDDEAGILSVTQSQALPLAQARPQGPRGGSATPRPI